MVGRGDVSHIRCGRFSREQQARHLQHSAAAIANELVVPRARLALQPVHLVGRSAAASSARPTWMATTSGRRAPQGHPIRHHQAVTPTRPSEAASMAFVWAALVQAIVHAGLEMISQSEASRTARQFQDCTPESYFPDR
jgi:hypothetical protein